ncbi:MAG TPA: proton-conducting transporter membrane subunit [Verrucomicrobiae bacterium]|nr:proton-conducting transporter membrane subunit [Verrucomicrobiae bacterium]
MGSASAADPFILASAACVLAALSGIPTLFPPLRLKMPLFPPVAMVAACLLGTAAGIWGGLSGYSAVYTLPLATPCGTIQAGLDPLSAWFLIPLFLVSGCCSVYASGYWPFGGKPSAPRLALLFGLLAASMGLLLLARDGILFLCAWELMAICAYLALSVEDEKKEVRSAAFLYLITTHAGTLALFGAFAMTGSGTAGYPFPAAGSLAPGAAACAVFCAALVGFGLKAGIMPLHVWLPGAHAAAPSHLSALMSGVIIKMGIYGIVRFSTFFSAPPLWWGVLLLAAGVVSGVAGVAFAIGQHDLKRLLAYHSIENIGIICIGLGLALTGRAVGNGTLVLLGFAGALLHVLNHAAFKSLLFLGAGSVIAACGTREMDGMGGVARRMPLSALFFLTGAVAICGLPPLNGFISEFLIYMGLFSGIHGSPLLLAVAAAGIPALAIIGGLAVACFVKVYGVVFLGEARHGRIPEREAAPRLTAPMGVLAAVCGLVGLAPAVLAPLLQRAAETAAARRDLPALAAEAPFSRLALCSALLLLLASLLWLRFGRKGHAPVTVTWDCGYLRPAPSMQYTSSSFAQMLVSLFRGILQPRRDASPIRELFPRAATFASHVPETVLDLVYAPLLLGMRERLGVVRRLQNGKLPLYILYILLTLVGLLLLAP